MCGKTLLGFLCNEDYCVFAEIWHQRVSNKENWRTNKKMQLDKNFKQILLNSV